MGNFGLSLFKWFGKYLIFKSLLRRIIDSFFNMYVIPFKKKLCNDFLFFLVDKKHILFVIIQLENLALNQKPI